MGGLKILLYTRPRPCLSLQGVCKHRHCSEVPSPCPAEHMGPYPGTASLHQPFRSMRNGVTPRPSPGKTPAGSGGAVPASLGLSGRRLETDPHRNTPADNVCPPPPPPLCSHPAAARGDSQCRALRYTRLCHKHPVHWEPSAGPSAGTHQHAKIHHRLLQPPSTNYSLIWIFVNTQTLKKGRPPVFTVYYVTGRGSTTYRAPVL